jgi:hypothetical protein
LEIIHFLILSLKIFEIFRYFFHIMGWKFWPNIQSKYIGHCIIPLYFRFSFERILYKSDSGSFISIFNDKNALFLRIFSLKWI